MRKESERESEHKKEKNKKYEYTQPPPREKIETEQGKVSLICLRLTLLSLSGIHINVFETIYVK